MTRLLNNPAPVERASNRDAARACSHCGLPVPAGLIERDRVEQFCCHACEAAYDVIHGCGLDAYYRLREQSQSSRAPARQSESDRLAVFDSAKFHELYVWTMADGTKATDLMLQGVHCAACVWLIEKLPRVAPGVIEARLSLREAAVRIVWDPAQTTLSHIAQALGTLGYTPHPARGVDPHGLHLAEQRAMLVRLGVAGALAGNTMLLAFALYAGLFGGMEKQFSDFFRWISAALGILALAWPGRVFFRGAWAAIRTRSPHLDLPIALALGVGGLAGAVNVVLGRGEIYFDSLTVLVFLLLVGRFIQYRQQRRADDSVGLLLSLTPTNCRRVSRTDRGEFVEPVPVEALAVGDLIEVRSGELIPADGVVEQGSASVIAALITGESRALPVGIGEGVFAGSRLSGSTLRLRVSATGEQSRVGKLMALVQRGMADKPSIVALTDRVAGWFVCVVSAIAFAVLAVWSTVDISLAIDHAVALLIIACPCALGLATPLTLAVAIGRSAKRDILIKSGAALDRLARPGLMLIDKTGTVTRGAMRVTAWQGDETLKPLIAQAQRHCTHPIARAIVESFYDEEHADDPRETTHGVHVHPTGVEAQTPLGRLLVGSQHFLAQHGITLPEPQRVLGERWSADAFTPVFVALDERVVASIAVGDALHDDACEALNRLRGWGWEVRMLTGDNPAVARQVGRSAGFTEDQIDAGVSPEQKLAKVKKRLDDRPIVMVGDGVNDAAALAAADVGVAVSGGAEASLVAADAYLARPGLSALADLVATARNCRRVIHRNLAVSLSYNTIAISLAALGMVNPLVAAVLMPISSALVLGLAMHGVRGAAGTTANTTEAKP